MAAITITRRVALAALLPVPVQAKNDDDLWKLLAAGGQVVLVRHGLTPPGVGDPPGMDIANCSTQRNLNAEGRKEAARLGEEWRRHNLPLERLMTSPWCRCIDTARLAFLRDPLVEPALSNLFGEGRTPRAQRQLAQPRPLVAMKPKRGNVVMVTHGSVVAALTGETPATTEMVVVTPEGGDKFRVAGRLRPG